MRLLMLAKVCTDKLFTEHANKKTIAFTYRYFDKEYFDSKICISS